MLPCVVSAMLSSGDTSSSLLILTCKRCPGWNWENLLPWSHYLSIQKWHKTIAHTRDIYLLSFARKSTPSETLLVANLVLLTSDYGGDTTNNNKDCRDYVDGTKDKRDVESHGFGCSERKMGSRIKSAMSHKKRNCHRWRMRFLALQWRSYTCKAWSMPKDGTPALWMMLHSNKSNGLVDLYMSLGWNQCH